MTTDVKLIDVVPGKYWYRSQDLMYFYVIAIDIDRNCATMTWSSRHQSHSVWNVPHKLVGTPGGPAIQSVEQISVEELEGPPFSLPAEKKQELPKLVWIDGCVRLLEPTEGAVGEVEPFVY